MTKECKTHGVVKHYAQTRKDSGKIRYYCSKCSKEAVSNRRRKVKRLLVEYKGGKCESCGYNNSVAAMDFHHKDSNKEFGISSKGRTLSLEKLKKEADKCTLLCANCHRELHATVAE